MTEGTSQGLFVVVAIVIFGIFVGMSYVVFGDTLKPAMVNIFTNSTEQATNNLNKSTPIIVDNYENTIFTYEFAENTAKITGFVTKQRYASLVIPHIIEKDGVKYPVTVVGAEAFKASIKDVTIPNSVVIIESHAFRNNELIDVVIPDSVVYIGIQAFYANKIKTLTLGNSVEIIESSAFYSNKLEEVYFPDSIRELHTQAFDIPTLKTISIPKSDTLTPDKIRRSHTVPDETQIIVR